MHAALLLGYGASAICPYMAFAVIDGLVKRGDVQLDYNTAEKNYIKALCKGLYKVMSKMGISTIRSYRGAKLFEAVGLNSEMMSLRWRDLILMSLLLRYLYFYYRRSRSERHCKRLSEIPHRWSFHHR